MERKMFDTPVLPRLETILAEVKSGDMVIPEFQRPFVWDDERRINLFDSIVAGMPIGSLLVWRTKQRDLRTYEHVGGIHLETRKAGDKLTYLIDGHQRISTLFGALYPGNRDTSANEEDWTVYYELGANDRPAFRLPPRRGTVQENWLPLHHLLDGDKLFEFTSSLRQKGKRDWAKEAERLANVFRDYIIPIVPLVTEELDVVTDAFVRINSQGKPMNEAHMLRALTHLGKLDTDKHFAEVRAHLEPVGWSEINPQVFVNILKAQFDLDVYKSGVREVHEKLKEDPAPLKGLADALIEAVGFLEFVGVCGPAALPYSYQLVTLAVVATRFRGQLDTAMFRDHLKHWFWVTTYGELYSGSTGTQIRAWIDLVADAFQGNQRQLGHWVAEPTVLERIRMSNVRTRAFLLFLAQLPQNEDARMRRQYALGTSSSKPVLPLFTSRDPSSPANCIIANAAEARGLRTAIKKNAVTAEMADEFGIPREAIERLPDEAAFLGVRDRWLYRMEEEFIRANLGLRIIRAEDQSEQK